MIMANHQGFGLLLQGNHLLKAEGAASQVTTQHIAPFTPPQRRRSPGGVRFQQGFCGSGLGSP